MKAIKIPSNTFHYAESHEELDYYEEDYNEDMGFDPYDGCYTYDC